MIKSEKIFKKFFFNKNFLTLVGLIAIILISFPFTKNAIKQYKINKEINDFKKEILDLQNKNLNLKNFVSYLGSDQFAEEQARLNLNLKKPGEELTVIKISDLASSTAVGPNLIERKIQEANTEVSNPKKWFNYFFKH
jgi:cell division protein FtsB